MSAWEILNLSPTKQHFISHPEVLSGAATQKQNNALAFESTRKSLARVHTQLILYSQYRLGGIRGICCYVTVFIISKNLRAQGRFAGLSSDYHVIQWICLRRNNVSSDTGEGRLQEARSMILGCVPLTTSVPAPHVECINSLSAE